MTPASHWHGGGYMGSMGMLWVLIGLVLLAAVWMFARSVIRGDENARETPEQALNRRYADGELGRETYERMLKELNK